MGCGSHTPDQLAQVLFQARDQTPNISADSLTWRVGSGCLLCLVSFHRSSFLQHSGEDFLFRTSYRLRLLKLHLWFLAHGTATLTRAARMSTEIKLGVAEDPARVASAESTFQ